MKSRSFQITTFDREDIDRIKSIPNRNYWIVGEEVCPTTNRDHWHIYIYFANPRSFDALKRALPRAHIEIVRGSPAQNRDYCSKEKVLYEDGDFPTQGSRSDLVRLHSLAESGSPFQEAVSELGVVAFRYEKLFLRMQSYYAEEEWEPKDIRIYWGETGTGKTRAVHTEYGDDLFNAFDWKWYDGYNGQRTVLFDEFPGCGGLLWFLRLTDRYKMDVQIKGGTVLWRPHRIIFTANTCPTTWWSDDLPVRRRAFFRRVTVIREFKIGPLDAWGSNGDTSTLEDAIPSNTQMP